MYSLARLLPLRILVLEQAPALMVSWVIAEVFYKFHSFTLELAAFLLTWLVVDAVTSFGRKSFGRNSTGGR